MKLPIILNHVQHGDQVVGHITPTDRGLKVTLNKGHELTGEQISALFGFCDFEIGFGGVAGRSEGPLHANEFLITRWSLTPQVYAAKFGGQQPSAPAL